MSSFISTVREYSFKPTLQTDQIFSCFGTSSEDAAFSILLKHDVAANIVTYMNNKLNMNICIICIKKNPKECVGKYIYNTDKIKQELKTEQ